MAASVAVVFAIVLGGVGLTGCTASGGSDAWALPPVIVSLDDVDGTTDEVPEGGTVDLTGDDETFTEWTADIADPEVVAFVPGRDDGSAQFNPGLTAESVGSAPRITMRPMPKGARLMPGKFWIDLSASPCVPGRLSISSTVIVLRETSSRSMPSDSTTVR